VTSLLAGAGRSVGAARGYDRLTRAVESGNEDAFLHATSELQQNDAWYLAERLVTHLVQTSRSVSGAPLLNKLGYTLAEKGQHKEQFVAAETLTRRAVKLLDETLESLEQIAATRPDVARALSQVEFSRANIRDSLAWALFRQGRYDEALIEQERALDEALSSGRGPTNIPQAEMNRSLVELHYHMGEIYRALRRLDEARAQYERAQKIDPSHALSAQGLRNLATAKPVVKT
jgi:tetratricopeptide (TPR) repeat protein